MKELLWRTNIFLSRNLLTEKWEKIISSDDKYFE